MELVSGVKAEVSGATVKLTGPKGSLTFSHPPEVQVSVGAGAVTVQRTVETARARAMHGLTRALIRNMVQGVSQGYSIRLELYGTGYSANVQGRNLLVNCGFMGRGVGKPAQFVLPIPDGVEVKVDVPQARGNTEPARFSVSGIDKQKVGQFAAEVRKLRKAEPYQGKGFRYAGEQIRRKAGKVFAGGGG